MPPKVTIFTTMKPFRGDIARIQRNAIRSWLALEPRPEVLVFGRDEGVADVCAEFGLRHVPEIRTAPSGAPYIDDLFAKAQQLATNEILCYLNADIILMSDFMWAMDTVFGQMGEAILIAAPRNLRLNEEIDPSRPGWEAKLREAVVQESGPPIRNGADVFAFPRWVSWNPPSAIVGRPAWDNAFMWRACMAALPAVDVTEAVIVVHQDHKTTLHSPQSWADVQWHPEARANLVAIPWWQRITWRVDIPYELRPDGRVIRRHLVPRARLYATVALRQTSRQTSAFMVHILGRTFGLRRRLGLYRWWRNPRT